MSISFARKKRNSSIRQGSRKKYESDFSEEGECASGKPQRAFFSMLGENISENVPLSSWGSTYSIFLDICAQLKKLYLFVVAPKPSCFILLAIFVAVGITQLLKW